MSVPPSELTNQHSSSFVLKDEIIRAGAGAGKTTALISKVINTALSFKKENGRFPHLVVTTFTRKATQELRERLLEKACELDDRELLSFASSKSVLHISSIHGVLNMFLLRYGFMAGIDPNYQMIDDGEQRKESRSILRTILLAEDKYKALLERYEFQRLINVLETLYSAKKVSPELEHYKLEDLAALAEGYLAKLSKDFSSVMDSILSESENQKWLDFANAFKEVEEEQKDKLYNEKYEALINWSVGQSKPRYSKKTPPVSEETFDQLGVVWKQVKKLSSGKPEDSFLDPKLWAVFISEMELLEEVREKYSIELEKKKLTSGKLTLSDLEEMSLELVRKVPVAGKVFSEQWDYWLIDEFQDTSPVQVELLEQLIGDKKRFIVGDPQQSIYLFRGARSEVFSEKELEIKAKGGVSDVLQKNYRSEPALLLFFNDFFSKLGQQFLPMNPREDVRKESYQTANKNLPEVAKFIITDNKNNEDEQSFIKALSEHLSKLLIKEKCRPEQICILARTNRTLEKVAAELIALNYPIHVNASSRFYSRREIVDAMSLLKFLLNPHDNLNLLTLLRSPWFKVEDEWIAEVVQNGIQNKESYWGLVLAAEEENSSSNKNPAVGILKNARGRLLNEGAVLVFRKLLESSGLFTWSRYIDATGRREANLWKLLNQLSDEEKIPGFNIIEFIQRRSVDYELASSGETDATAVVEPDRINLMTIHASKGLQFDHVIVPDLHKAPTLSKSEECSVDRDNKKWVAPVFVEESSQWIHSIGAIHIRDKEREKELLEQERLLYVALTRAKQSVLMHWDEGIRKNSLAEKICWDTGINLGEESEDYIVEKQSYKYKVERSGWEFKSYPVKEKEQRSVRSVFMNSSDIEQEIGPSTVSVSQFLDQKLDGTSGFKLGDSASNQDEYDKVLKFQKTIEGSLLHQAFEALKYSSYEEILDGFSKHFLGKEKLLKKSLDFICQLQDPPLLQIIKNGEVEAGFICQLDEGVTIEGQMDLWGDIAEEDGSITTWIVDYKTGSPKFSERAFQQLALYAEAIKKRKGWGKDSAKKIKLAVVYPLLGKVEIR